MLASNFCNYRSAFGLSFFVVEVLLRKTGGNEQL